MSFSNEPWAVDHRALLSKHDVVYQSPPYEGYEGFPLGNGDIGAMVWNGPSSTIFAINKSDAWDRKGAGAGEESLTALRSCGRVIIEESVPAFSWEQLGDFEARLDMYNADVRLESETPLSRVNLQAYIPHETNAIVVHYDSERSKKARLRIALERWGSRVIPYWYSRCDPVTGDPVADTTTGTRDDAIWLIHPLADRMIGLACIAKTVDQDAPTPEIGAVIDNDHRVTLEIAPRDRHRFTVVIGVALVEHDGDDPAENGERAVQSAVREARSALGRLESVREHHLSYWHDFWSKGFVKLPDDYLENLYYFNLYQMASSSKGAFPNLFCGGLWIWNHDIRNWTNPHHWNQQMLTWPLFAANRLDLTLPYIKTYHRLFQKAREYSAELGCPEGIQITENHTFFGDMLGRHSNSFRYNYTPAAQIGLIMWWYFKYSGDQEFLRDVAYPWLKAVLRFYLHLLQWDDQRNVYTWYPATPYECGTQNVHRDTITDNAMVRWLTKVIPEAIGMLNVDEDLLGACTHLAASLPEFPTMQMDDGAVAFGSGYLEDGPAVREPDMFGAYYAPVFPAGVIGLADKGTDRFELAKASVRSHKLSGPCIAPKVAALARLGLGEEAWKNLIGSVRRLQHFPQGFFYNLDHWCVNSPRFDGDLTTFAAYLQDTGNEDHSLHRDYIHDRRSGYNVRSSGPDLQVKTPAQPFVQAGLESMGLFCLGIHETLLQSHEGVIRVFPAVPETWSGGFRLRAQGGFLVSSYTENGGRCAFVVVMSETGGRCSLDALFQGGADSPLRVYDRTSDADVAYALADKMITFPTESDHVYVVGRGDITQGSLFPPIGGDRNNGPKRLFEAELGKARDFPRVDRR